MHRVLAHVNDGRRRNARLCPLVVICDRSTTHSAFGARVFAFVRDEAAADRASARLAGAKTNRGNVSRDSRDRESHDFPCVDVDARRWTTSREALTTTIEAASEAATRRAKRERASASASERDADDAVRVERPTRSMTNEKANAVKSDGDGVIVSVSAANRLARAFGAREFAAFVRALRLERSARCVLLSVRSGSSDGVDVVANEASCVVNVRADESDLGATKGRVDIETRTPYGRRRRECARVRVRDDGGVEFAADDVDDVVDFATRALKVRAHEGAGDVERARADAARRLQASVSFNLGVSLDARERRAKSNVALAYEHQGRGVAAEDAYASGDFLTYLPRAAGGLAADVAFDDSFDDDSFDDDDDDDD